MPNVPVTANQFDAGVYQIETNDPVVGGAAGISNKQAINLANRTAFLKAAIDAVIAAEGGIPDNADPTLLYAAIQSAVSAGAAALPAIVTQASAEAGTSTTARLWTAQRVKQAIAALVSLRAQSTTAQALAGINTTTDMSPARVTEAMTAFLKDVYKMSVVAKSINTIYTTINKPRALAAAVSLTIFNGSCDLEVNFAGAGFILVQSWGINGGVGSRGNLSYVIPPLTQYRIAGSTSIVSWSESA